MKLSVGFLSEIEIVSKVDFVLREERVCVCHV